jgi:hypothetical protein
MLKRSFLFICIAIFISVAVFSEEVTAEHFMNVIAPNSVRNDGKTFDVRGTVSYITASGRSPFSEAEIYVGLPYNNFWSMSAIFDWSHYDELKNLNPGDVVVIRGVCDDRSLKRCTLIRVEKNGQGFPIKSIYAQNELFMELIQRRTLQLNGRTIQFTVKIRSIERRRNSYVLTVGDSLVFSVECWFSSDNLEDILNLEVGNDVTIRGTYSIDQNPFSFSNCIIIK